MPPQQLLHALQPHAKFIITVSDPAARMYSDYYFLDDNLKPLRPGVAHSKSPQQFHSRVVTQINSFHACVNGYVSEMKKENGLFLDGFKNRRKEFNAPDNVDVSISNKQHPDFPLWFRASQMCAHDRHSFAVGGHGRIAIGT